MGVIEVWSWLNNKAKEGDDNFYSPKEVFQGMVGDGLLKPESNLYRCGSISVGLGKLEAKGYLEVEVAWLGWRDFQRRYRVIKDKIVYT